MTEQEIERCLERFATCKTTDVMNFDYAGTLAYIQRLKAENAELKSSLTHANEECLKWHERAQNLLKDSGGSISGYEKKISDLQAENAALRERLKKAVELPPGDRVWYIAEDEEGEESYIISKPTNSLAVEELKYEIGKKYFTTREAAEKRLAELNGGKQ